MLPLVSFLLVFVAAYYLFGSSEEDRVRAMFSELEELAYIGPQTETHPFRRLARGKELASYLAGPLELSLNYYYDDEMRLLKKSISPESVTERYVVYSSKLSESVVSIHPQKFDLQESKAKVSGELDAVYQKEGSQKRWKITGKFSARLEKDDGDWKLADLELLETRS